ncbi:MAG: hypothetical protein KAH38_07195 [Candidatus Hydrogenedentes bacterium]|nr:hypothetical protein [Candidatus Hydrogenedentota bacterium]
MLLRALKMSFWVFYDHLGKLLVVNFFSACCVLVPLLYAFHFFEIGDVQKVIWISFPVFLITVIFIIPLVQVGLLWMIKEIIEKRDGSLKTYFVGIRIFGLRAVGLGLIYVVCSMALLISVWFYAIRLGGHLPLVGYGLSALAGWMGLLLSLSALLVLPALINKNVGIGGAIKMAVVLLLDNPLFIIGVAVHGVVLLLFCVVPPVFLFLSFAPLAALQGSAYEILSRKYAAFQAHVTETGGIDKSVTIDFGDEDDEYLCRGFRDLLFPWKE